MRRSQAERRRATIARLIEATIEAMHDVGYARTTIKEICTRSGVSQGGLFRHFDTRLDLVVATADEVARRHAAAFSADLGTAGSDRLQSALRAARARCRSPINAVWHELMTASRTDAELREAIAPAAARHRESIEGLARDVLGDLPGVAAMTWFVIHCFDGEAIGRTVLADPDGEELRFQWLMGAVLGALSGASHGPPAELGVARSGPRD